MSLYTVRNGMRTPIAEFSLSSKIDVDTYNRLFSCCRKYCNHINHMFSGAVKLGRDNSNYLTSDDDRLMAILDREIPNLYKRKYGKKMRPGIILSKRQDVEYDQYALLDFIEFVSRNMVDCEDDSCNCFSGFKDSVNGIFNDFKLCFTLTDSKQIERIYEDNVLLSEVEITINVVEEHGIKGLLNESIRLFKRPNPNSHNLAVDKLWDAFERLKSYYSTLNKRESAEKIIKNMSNAQSEFEKLFNEEFAALTKIGNDFRIRHHELNKIDITDEKHYAYFFNRCLSLIATAIQYLE